MSIILWLFGVTMHNPYPQAVLFDLDGTLLDTAPDMAAALNQLRIERDMQPMPLAEIRPQVSNGARGLLQIGLALTPNDATFTEARTRFLALYAQNIAEHTELFPGLDDFLHRLAELSIPWGIVTNKPAALTHQLLKALALPCDTVVCGDDLKQAKPAPDPLIYAAGLLRTTPDTIWYVGDHERDIIAGNRAGMTTIAGRWGYLDYERPIEQWGADCVIDQPGALGLLLNHTDLLSQSTGVVHASAS